MERVHDKKPAGATAGPGSACQGEPRYRPIRDYAAIGDCHGSALVSSAGDVDWGCLGRFDADPVFCRILDSDKGGFFSIRPRGFFRNERAYCGNTNVLTTRFVTEQGEVTVTDFMPVGRVPGVGVHDYVTLNAPGWLVRKVDGVRGTLDLDVRYMPAVQFAARRADLARANGAIVSADGAALYGRGLDIDGSSARATVRIDAGDSCSFVVSAQPLVREPSPGEIDRLLAITVAFWEEWIAYCRYDGCYKGPVLRSALALKLMTYAPSGALVAALTTSLPEEIGGTRNWDYRYCWLRDACLTLYALAALGYGGEARRFCDFLSTSCESCGKTRSDIQIMYGIASETVLEEHVLDHLDGYAGSRPVRTGNGAYSQRQLDVLGAVLDWAQLFEALGGRLTGHVRELMEGLVAFVSEHWRKPDSGIWEMRGDPLHHVHGKLMCWVAVDRAVGLFGSRPEWVALRESIEADVRARGIDSEQGHFLQAYGRPGTDAALLQLPMLGFPVDDELLVATAKAIEKELRQGDLVWRYRTEDSLPGQEGAFFICSFWLVDYLLSLGRYESARALFERLLKCSNDIGLYAEEISPDDGAHLGNFPQAFTHLALVNSATNLQLFETGGEDALRGSYADRARGSVGATLGWRAVWAAFKHSRRTGRFLSSRQSILPESLLFRVGSR